MSSQLLIVFIHLTLPGQAALVPQKYSGSESYFLPMSFLGEVLQIYPLSPQDFEAPGTKDEGKRGSL